LTAISAVIVCRLSFRYFHISLFFRAALFRVIEVIAAIAHILRAIISIFSVTSAFDGADMAVLLMPLFFMPFRCFSDAMIFPFFMIAIFFLRCLHITVFRFIFGFAIFLLLMLFRYLPLSVFIFSRYFQSVIFRLPPLMPFFIFFLPADEAMARRYYFQERYHGFLRFRAAIFAARPSHASRPPTFFSILFICRCRLSPCFRHDGAMLDMPDYFAAASCLIFLLSCRHFSLFELARCDD